jgi:molybdopterin/thiamine biosynthesis adenylyltransferase
VQSRLELAGACERLGLPLVHGSIAGWYGLAATQLPGGKGLRELYAQAAATKGIELELGNPSFTPAVAASIEAAEVCKLLTSTGPSLAGRLLSLDLRNMEFSKFEL